MTAVEPATILAIADAVKDALNAADFSQPFEAERLYVPRYELKEMETLRVSVVPSAADSELASRNQTRDEYRVDVGIQKRFRVEDVLELDPLVAFTQEVADSFRFSRLDLTPLVTWVRSVVDPVYVPDHIEQLRQFTSVIRLTYRMVR